MLELDQVARRTNRASWNYLLDDGWHAWLQGYKPGADFQLHADTTPMKVTRGRSPTVPGGALWQTAPP